MTTKSPSFADFDFSQKRVLLRADLNVPLQEGKAGAGVEISEDFRLVAMLPTLKALQQRGARTILISHLGRPEGHDPALSLKPIAERLGELLGNPVKFVPAIFGPDVDAAIEALQPGEILLLENLRFDPREEKNDPDFARALAALADIYVNDAFAVSHRAHASTVGVTAFLPALAGPLLEHELAMLHKALHQTEAPLLAIIGGAKISTKLALIENVAHKADCLFVGGAMANTFLAAQGIDIGPSLAEPELIPTANLILLKASRLHCELMLPLDAIAAPSGKSSETQTAPCMSLPKGMGIFDIGPATLLRLKAAIAEAQTIIWNGPLGLFENPVFSHGTFEVAKLLAARAEAGATVVAGGGDTVAALAQTGLTDKLTFVSTAGGAFLEWLEGKTLPGIAALNKEKKDA